MRHLNQKILSAALGGFTLLTCTSALIAGEQITTAPEIEESEPWTFKNLWDYPTLYKNKENPVIQKFAIVGRFQVDYSLFDGDQGKYDDWGIRRFRLGFKTTLFQDFTLHMEADLDAEDLDVDDLDGVYNKLTDAYIAWSSSKKFKLKIGKQSAGFTLDGKTSSKKLITTERNNLTNNLWFTKEYFTGLSGSGKIDNWRYFVGGFSSSAPEEFSEFDAGYFGLAAIGYDFSESMNVDQSLLTLQYVYNDPNENNGTAHMRQVISLNHQLEAGSWGLRSDLAAGQGYGSQSDLWGAVLMPFYTINDNFQVVGRYTYLSSADDNGVRLNRYEKNIESGKGDRYNEVFLGVNWYLNGHKLKLQTGLQYAWMDDAANDGGTYSGWGWNTGLRIYW